MTRRREASDQLADIAKWMHDVARGRIAATEKELRLALARKVAGRVQTKYREYPPQSSEMGTMLALAGKEKGAVRPARTPRSPRNIMEMLGQTVRARVGAKPGTYEVGVSPTATLPPEGHKRWPAGVPFRLLAHWIENPRPYTIRMTLRQLGYIYAVREGRGGLGTRKVNRHLPDKRTSHVMVVNPPDRPVWRAVARELHALAKRYYQLPYFRTLKRIGRQYGMR